MRISPIKLFPDPRDLTSPPISALWMEIISRRLDVGADRLKRAGANRGVRRARF